MSTGSTDPAPPPSRASQIGLWLGPLWLVICLLAPAPAGMPDAAWACVGLALLMATWWSTEAISIPATALLPLALAPALGIGGMNETAASYANPIIYLFLGGFLLGIAMQRWNLHRRIALLVLRVVGQQPRRQIGGFMIATGFLSMWVSNTATAAAFLPLLGALALSLDISPLLITVPAAIAASCAFMMPVATPPNAIVFATGHLKIQSMIRAGFALNLLGTVVVSLLGYSLLLLLW